MKKKTRKSLVRELDTLLSKIVRARDLCCVICGSKKSLTCGHLFTRINYSTRWSLINCHCQCLSCNLKHEYDPWPYMKWFINKYGQEKLDKLHQEHHQLTKFKDMDLAILLEQLKPTLLMYNKRNMEMGIEP